MSTNLIDTYVSEVGCRLPRKTHTDIEAEIRSILQDMLEERSQKTGKPVDDEMTLDILKAYGAPEKVAATYQGERYLIGPRLYPVFLMVFKIAFPIIAILAGVGAIINVAQHVASVDDVSRTVFYVFTGVVTSVISALGNIVLVFAFLEWALFRAGGKVVVKGLPKEKEWDPRSLTKVSSPNQVKMGDTIAEIVGCFAAIVIFNFYPQIIGFGYAPNGNWYVGAGNWTFIPLLSVRFFYFVPYLTLIWALTIALDIVLLRMGHWNTLARTSSIGLKVIGIIIPAVMMAGPSLLAITADTLTASLGDAGEAQILITFLSQLVHLVLWLAIIVGSLDVVRLTYRLITNKELPLDVPQEK
jgi:hypothetical protein